MDINDLVARQRDFDERRQTTFAWSSSITGHDIGPLIHNVLSLSGEVGEMANLVKKYDRGDFDFDILMKELPSELADVAIYLIKIAYQSGIDLEEAVLDKIAANEKRFPTSPVSPSIDRRLSESQQALLATGASKAAGLSRSRVEELFSMYREVHVEPPRDVDLAVTGALLAVEFARAAVYEGNPDKRERVWLGLEPVAALLGLDRVAVAALTKRDLAFQTLLDESDASIVRQSKP